MKRKGVQKRLHREMRKDKKNYLKELDKKKEEKVEIVVEKKILDSNPRTT